MALRGLQENVARGHGVLVKMPCLAGLLVGFGLCEIATGELLLAEAGKALCMIVVRQDADVSTRAVAEDFAGIMEEITGATFPVVTDDSEFAAREIIIGEKNAHLQYLGLSEVTSGFGQGEYEIRTVGEHLVICGAPPRGTINGIYGFLQDYLGCRWFTPGCSRLPEQATLELGDICDRQKPSFVWRSTNVNMHWDAAWTARNRLNECKTGGGGDSLQMLMSDPRVKTIGNYASGHMFSYIPKSLYDEHPEYVALVGGRRVWLEARQRAFCLTNEGFVEYMADLLKRSLRGTTGPRFVSTGHADSANRCQCAECRQSYDRLGIAGTYMTFTSKVAERVASEYPQAIISTLAYGITFTPPAVKMHANVRVVWCPIGSCFAHALDECPANTDRHRMADLAKWLANCSHVGVYYYQVQCDGLMPHLRLAALARNLAIFNRMGVKSARLAYDHQGIRTNAAFDGDKLLPAYGRPERSGYFTVPFGLDHLRAYIGCRLMWDAQYDWKQGVREFCEAYYGPAADELVRFVLMVESIGTYEKTLGADFTTYPGIHQLISISPMLKYAGIERMNDLFDQALQAVGEDRTYRRRVEMARTSLDLAILCFVPGTNPLRGQAFDRFFTLMEEVGLRGLRRTIASYERTTLAEFKALMAEPEKIILPGQQAVGANLLVNSNFETEVDADGVPDEWGAEGKYLPEGYLLDPKGVTLDLEKACSGRQSVRLTKIPEERSIVSLRQRFDVKPGESYRASVRYQADVKTGSVHMIFTAFDKEGHWLRHQSGTRGVRRTGDKWATLYLDTKCEEDTAQLMIEFFFYDDRSEGVAWIDDFECAPIDDR